MASNESSRHRAVNRRNLPGNIDVGRGCSHVLSIRRTEGQLLARVVPRALRGGAARSLLWLTVGIVCAPLVRAEAPSSRPNIVILLSDDQGWADVNWRNPRVHTPNLDKYCREGIRLDQQYVTPMCSPTRATLLSGRYASRFGVSMAQNERAYPFGTTTLASALKSVGYDTALIGKWHLGSAPEWGPQKFGFDYSYGTLAGGCGPYSHLYKPGPYERSWHRNGKLITEEGHVTDLITREAVKWLGERGDKPFLLYVPFTAPHVPIKEPKKWLDVNAEVEVPAKREYYSSVAHMDWAVGQIMAALDKSGKRANTLVLFLSDNGAIPDQSNDKWLISPDPREKFTPGPAGGSNLPLRGKKTMVYEGGIRVPAFVNWPGKLKPGEFAGVVHAADWMPTLCGLAGYRSNTDLNWDGHDVWAQISGGAPVASRQLYWVSPHFLTSAVRDGNWKLVVTKEGNRAELFDLAADPNEKDDLAVKYPERVAALRQLMAQLSAHDNEDKVVEAGGQAGFVPDDDNYPFAGYRIPRYAYTR